MPFGLQSPEFPQADRHSEKELPELRLLNQSTLLHVFTKPL